jgi:hypothetical protein
MRKVVAPGFREPLLAGTESHDPAAAKDVAEKVVAAFDGFQNVMVG